MGAEDVVDAKPVHRVTLSDFRMSRFPITNEEYQLFVEDTGRTPPEPWPGGTIPEGKENHPVVYVAWTDAEAYCTWLTRRLEKTHGGIVQLPTEAQWEFAARGEDGRKYPWGKDEPSPGRRILTGRFMTPRPWTGTPAAPRPTVFTTWPATCGSGAVTGMGTTMTRKGAPILPGRKEARRVCCAVARSSSMRATCGLRIATASPR